MNERIPYFYQVVHDRDLVPHVPPCMGFSFCELEDEDTNWILWVRGIVGEKFDIMMR